MQNKDNSKPIDIKFDFILYGRVGEESLRLSLASATNFTLEYHLHNFASPQSARSFLRLKGGVDSRYLYVVRLIIDLLKRKEAYSDFAKNAITQKW